MRKKRYADIALGFGIEDVIIITAVIDTTTAMRGRFFVYKSFSLSGTNRIV
jgi:hypothetical protein